MHGCLCHLTFVRVSDHLRNAKELEHTEKLRFVMVSLYVFNFCEDTIHC